MKFWVRAITDGNVQEQLFVDAASVEGLAKELSGLLHTNVLGISVTDFQAQVVDKINSGDDIVTVKVETTRRYSNKRSELDDSLLNAVDNRQQQFTPRKMNDTTSFLIEDEDLPLSSLSASTTDGPAAMRMAKASQLLLESTPQVDRICLKREQVELLLHPYHGDTYYSVMTGCFVRMRWHEEYVIHQIARVVSRNALVFDMIHYEETYGLEVVSNAPPMLQEVISWGKRMQAASRPFVTDGFIEAKLGDVDSALRAARAVCDRHVEQVLLFAVPPAPPTAREGRMRRTRATICAAPRAVARMGFDRLVLKTNDTLLHTHICIVEEPELGDFSAVLFASRLSNCRARKMRLSDIAGCMMRLAKCGQMSIVASDRDVTEKGYEMLCPPLRWDCRYITLGVERLRSDGLPYLNSCGTWVQDFTLLSGRFFSNLFNPPIATSLPIPAWAQGEGISALIWRPHLVAHKGKLHLFYLIRLVGSYLPQCSVLCADTRGTSAATAVAGTRDADRHVDSVPMDQSQFVKAEDTGAELNNYSFCGDNVQFSLAHAVSRDDSLHTWSTVTESAPLLSCYSKAPLFTVASVPPLDFHTVGPGISPKRVAGPTENVLQLLWYEEDASEQWSAASPYISPTLCKLTGGNFGNRVPLPFQRWVNAHSDAEPECWEREPSYSSIRVDPDFMKSSVSSLSLYEHEGTVFVASVQQDAHQRTLLMSVPLTAEP